MQMTMNLYDFTKKYSTGKGEGTMWKTVAIISEAVEKSMSEQDQKALLRKMYSAMAECHYNEEFAREDVAKMYYVDEDGIERYAPYWTESQIRDVYESVREEIPEYNMWDFYVTMQMVKSDNCPLLRRWFPDASPSEMDEKFVELAVNWLNDSDNPYGSGKIWHYLNG